MRSTAISDEGAAVLNDKPIFAYIPATDLDRARKFYEETIGLTPNDPNENGVTYKGAGNTAVFLYVTPNAGTNQASTMFWGVDDIRAEVDELKAKGVVFENYDNEWMHGVDDVYIGGGAKAAWFRDPDGNTLALIEDGED
jgi:catechol 2,3-dioxygenase-like lactoylglutathione lyase family enzyme